MRGAVVNVQLKETVFFSVIALFQVCALYGQPEGSGDSSMSGEWVRAAQNREWAADTCADEAETYLAYAEQLRKKEYLYEQERRSNMEKAGDAEKKAGSLLAKALRNYDRASVNWSRAEREYKTTAKSGKAGEARSSAETNKKAAADCCRKAAEAYEAAARAYGRENADKPEKAAGASEMAARYREMLAAGK
ncbi:MAG: hypothetical protein R6V03_08775 [Kiritimatiellia bacterium]